MAKSVRAAEEAKEILRVSYKRFLNEPDTPLKNKAGEDLIRTIFGKNAIPEDSIL